MSDRYDGRQVGHASSWEGDPDRQLELVRAYLAGYGQAVDDARRAMRAPPRRHWEDVRRRWGGHRRRLRRA